MTRYWEAASRTGLLRSLRRGGVQYSGRLSTAHGSCYSSLLLLDRRRPGGSRPGLGQQVLGLHRISLELLAQLRAQLFEVNCSGLRHAAMSTFDPKRTLLAGAPRTHAGDFLNELLQVFLLAH
jgi:hypothetical protein